MLLLYVCVGVCVTLDESVPTWCYVESVVCPLQVQSVLMYLNFWCTFFITLNLILFHYHLLMNTTRYLVVCSILMVINDGQKPLVLFLLSPSPALSAGEFDLTVLYSASLLVLYISDCTLHLCSYFTSLLVLCISVASSLIIMHFTVFSYMSLLLLYIPYSAFLRDLVASMVFS